MSGICSCSPSREDRVSFLEAEAVRFSQDFPGLSIRFAEILGRRVSYIAGVSPASASCDLRLDLPSGLAAFVSGPWPGMEEEIRAWAGELQGGRPGR